MNPAKKIKSPACGWCHPGGGSMEYGRRPDGTPDFSMNLIQAERRNTNSLDGDFMSLISPDGKSHFKESGVVEGTASSVTPEDTSSASVTSRSIT